jgi:hypothetical protein
MPAVRAPSAHRSPSQATPSPLRSRVLCPCRRSSWAWANEPICLQVVWAPLACWDMGLTLGCCGGRSSRSRPWAALLPTPWRKSKGCVTDPGIANTSRWAWPGGPRHHRQIGSPIEMVQLNYTQAIAWPAGPMARWRILLSITSATMGTYGGDVRNHPLQCA